LSSARAAVVSVERPDAVDEPDVALPLLYEPAVPVFESMRAFVPLAVELLSVYDVPCGFCVFAGTVGDALATTEPDAAEDTLPEVVAAGAIVPVDVLGLPPSLAVEVVLGVVALELVVCGDFLSFLKSPIASALPAAKARIEVVRNIGASLRIVISMSVGWIGTH
jgi:hypothetical protein